MRKFYLSSTLVLLAILFGNASYSQDFSNKGKDFWVGYGYHAVMTSTNPPNPQEMVLYFAADQNSNVTVTIPALGYTANYFVAAGTVVTSSPIPKFAPQDARLLTEGISNNGIHITSDKAIVAYSHIYYMSASGATILFPTNTLGTSYYSINYENLSNASAANCWFYVLATDTGTTNVKITPSANTTGGWIAGNTYNISLTQGQIYNVMGDYGPPNFPNNNTGVDLTGSLIEAVGGSSGCNRIAVFSGSGRIGIGCGAAGGSLSSDNYMVQAVPKAAWGTKYLTSPTSNLLNNIFRICVSHPAANVLLNGAPIGLPLQNGFYYEIAQTSSPMLIESDSAITVAQYITSQNFCGNGAPGDPEVIYLSPVQQSINKVLWNATPNFAITQHYYNVIITNKGTALSSFVLDGVPVPAASFTIHPQESNYSYLSQPVNAGQHVIQSDSGFNAMAYGFGTFESYGYNAGTNVKDLYQQILLNTQYGIEPTPTICSGTPFKFKVSLPYCADSIQWNLSNLPGPPAQPATQIYASCGAADSTTVVNGKTIYWYSLPSTYVFTTVGTYPVTIFVYAPNAGSCGNVQDIDFDLEVTPSPSPGFSWVPNTCAAEPVQFTETTPQTPKPTYSFYWNFGDPASGAANISNIRNPSHTFTAPGTYTVRYAAITTPGCLTDTVSQQVTINPMPAATIAGTATACVGGAQPPVTFTGTPGTGPYTFYYHINAGGPLSINTATTTATVNASTAVAGTFVYTLDSVRITGSALCVSPLITGQTTTITVNPLPTASVSGTITVCQNAASPTITFTGAGSTAPYTFTYNINGGPNQTVVSVGATASVSVPTGTTGTFTYTLVSVQDGTSSACSQAQSGTATVTVNPVPTASVAGTITVCRNAPSPNITFNGANGTAPYTFTYNINGGPNQTVVSAGNSATVAASTAAVGTFIYNLVSVQDANGSLCSNPQSGSATVTVNPLPTASVTGTISVCQNATAPTITFTGAGTTSPYTFTYNINGGPNQTIVSVGNTATLTASTATPGTFTYNLVSVQDASAAACSQAQTGSAVVTVNPSPTANITGTIAVCRNAPSPNVTFTGTTGTAPFTFTYTINGGPNQTVVSVGNTATVAVPTGTTGTFVYALVSVQDASPSTCSQAQSGSVTVTVNPLPTASIAGTITVCRNAAAPPVTFTGAGGTTPYTFTYNINGGPNQTVVSVGNTATVNASTAVAGTFTYTLVSVQDASATLCSQSQSGNVVVTVTPLPTAAISGTIQVCQNGPSPTITFTGAASTAPYTFTYNINGGPNQTVVSVGNTATVSAPTGTAGTFTYNLVSVQDASANTCSQAQTGTATVTVTPLPTANISGTITVCRNGTAPNITFTGAAGTAPYTFTYNINGGPNQTVVSSGNTATVSASTTVAGTFTYNLVSVQDASAGLCNQLQSGSATVTVNPLPTANVTGTITVCQNATAPAITFTGAGTTAPYTFTYNINGGPNQTVVSVGNTATVTASTAVPGTFTYNLVSVQDASATTCSQAQTGSATVTVSPSPTANISGTNTVCLNASSPNITFTGTAGTAPFTFTYTINGGPNQTVTSVGNTATVAVPTSTAGTFVYALVSVQDASANLCSQTQTGNVTITVNPLPAAIISGAITVCKDAPAPNVTFTGSGGAAPYTFTYTINGGANQTVVSSGNTATVSVPTATVGSYTYALVNVQEGSALACSRSETGSVTVTVNPAPTASITGAVTVCEDDPAPNVTFTGGGTTAPYTFTYTINSGPNQTVTSVGNTATVSVPTTTPGTYTYALVSVQDGSPTTCSAVQSGSVVIQVDADHTMTLSSATSTTSQTVCSGKLITPVTYVLGGGATGATITGLPAGLTSSVTGNTLSITGAPTSIGLQGYTIQTTGTTCDFVTVNNTIDVLQTPTVQFNPVAGICADVAPFTVSGLPAGGTFSGTGVNAGGLFTPSVAGAGNHTIRYTYVAANGCSNFAEQIIPVYPLPVVDAGPDKGLIEGGQVTLTPNVTANFNITYLWTPPQYLSNPAIRNPVVSNIPSDQVYQLTVTSDNGCSANDFVNVKLLKKIEVPNIFSPNGDGVHDTWVIPYLDSYPGNTVEVFNRYGQRIFYSEGYGKPWDGTVNGKQVPVGTYYYIITPKNGRLPMAGYVDIIR